MRKKISKVVVVLTALTISAGISQPSLALAATGPTVASATVSAVKPTPRQPEITSSSSKLTIQGLQYILRAYGNRSVAVNGIYGPETKKAVADYQRTAFDYRGPIDGRSDTRTLRSMLSKSNMRLQENWPNADSVKALQSFLRDNGWTSVAVDGSFGPVTKNAVIGFQKAHGLRQTGIVDWATWSYLVD